MNRSSGEGTVLGQGLAHGLGTWPLLSSWAAEDLQDDWGAQDAVTQVNASPVVTDLQHDGLLALGPGAPWSDADLYPGDAALDTPLLRIALVLLYALLAATGFTSNVLVCCVVARQSMRKTTAGKMIPRHLYIANLAVADVLICLLALPGTLWWLLQGWAASPAVPVVASDGVPQLDVPDVPRMAALCRALPGLQCVCAGAAAGTVAAIALDRYRAIVTRAHDATSSRRAVPRVIAAIWAAACALAAPLVAFHGVVDVDGVPRCVSQWPAPAPAWRLSYACVRAVLHFLLPALSLCVVHTRISAYLHSRPMQWRRRRSRRTALVLGTVAAVFTFSWLPLTAFQLLVTNPGQHRVMFACCHLLAMSSTLSNPLLYGWLNSHFRREIRAMLPCCCAPRKERHSRTVCKACRARQERALAKELEGRPEPLLVAAAVAGAGGAGGVRPTAGFCRTCWRCAGVGTRAGPGGHGRGTRRHLFHLQLPDQPDRRGSLTFLTSLTARHSITLLTHLSGGTTGTTTTTSRLDIL